MGLFAKHAVHDIYNYIGCDETVQYEDRLRRNSGTFINPHPALLRPASPLLELATAGNYIYVERIGKYIEMSLLHSTLYHFE